MVSTRDSESRDPSSNPVGTSSFLLLQIWWWIQGIEGIAPKSVGILVTCLSTSVKKYTGARGELAPEMLKRAPESHKRAPPPNICIEFNAKQIKDFFFFMQANTKIAF